MIDGTHPPEEADLLEMMQTAQSGSGELDARIDCVLLGRTFVGMAGGLADTSRCYCWLDADLEGGSAEPASRWSEDVMASLQLIPADHNYSIGRRDGVCWAWIQPNDDWTPIGAEYRHDHRLGSGLVVAYTMALALMTAVMVILTRDGFGAGTC